MISRYDIDWKVPDNIGFFISTNQTGHSKGKYKSANFSFSVGDNVTTIAIYPRLVYEQRLSLVFLYFQY